MLPGSTRPWTRTGRGRGVGAQLYILHLFEIVALRPVYVRLALLFLHHPAWMESHTGGSRLTPTVHPCPVQLGRLWVAYVVYDPNRPQEGPQPVHGSGAEVQDHDPGTSQPAQLRGSQLHSLRQQFPRHQASQRQDTQEMLENATLVTQFGKEDTAVKSQSHAARIQDTLENAEVTEIKCAVFRALTRLKSYRDEGIRRD